MSSTEEVRERYSKIPEIGLFWVHPHPMTPERVLIHVVSQDEAKSIKAKADELKIAAHFASKGIVIEIVPLKQENIARLRAIDPQYGELEDGGNDFDAHLNSDVIDRLEDGEPFQFEATIVRLPDNGSVGLLGPRYEALCLLGREEEVRTFDIADNQTNHSVGDKIKVSAQKRP